MICGKCLSILKDGSTYTLEDHEVICGECSVRVRKSQEKVASKPQVKPSRVEFTKDQKIEIMKSALEHIKDAPLLQEEKDEIAREALMFVDWGTYQVEKHTLSSWGQAILTRHLSNATHRSGQ